MNHCKLFVSIKTLLCVFLFFNTITTNAQTFEWAKSYGQTTYDHGYAISIDKAGNTYTTGGFLGTVDFDPGPGVFNLSSNGSLDVYVQKLDSSGNFIWAKSFGGTMDEEGYAIKVDDLGNIYATGHFESVVDFDPGSGVNKLTSNGGWDVFIHKMDSAGNLLWAKSFGGNKNDKGESIGIDNKGNVYTLGFILDTVDFDPGPGSHIRSSAGSLDVFVQKLDAAGNFVWANTFGGTGFDLGYSIDIDTSGNIYSTGRFEGTADFDPGTGIKNLTSAGDADIFVHKMDSSGNLLWAKSFGGTKRDFGHSLAIDVSGHVYTTGYFQGTVDFDPGTGTMNHTSYGGLDAFVQKLSPSGNFMWSRTFGGTKSDYGNSISVDLFGSVYTTGIFRETVDFDPGTGVTNLMSQGLDDIFIQILDSAGTLKWARSFGGSDNDEVIDISLDEMYNMYTIGHFRDTADFNPDAGVSNLISNGSKDVFVQKIKSCITKGVDVQTACDKYTWINGITYYSNNNTATYFLKNSKECDSVVTLNLTLNTVTDINTSLSGVTILASNSNATYQWLDCDNNYAVLSGETNQSFTPQVNGNYAVELTENSCVDTSICRQITTVGLTGNELLNQLKVYPNPANDFLFLENIPENMVMIELIDGSGNILYRSNSPVQRISLGKIPSGVYVVRIEMQEGVVQQKIIVD